MQLTELSIRSQNLFIRDYIEEKRDDCFLIMIYILSTHGKKIRRSHGNELPARGFSGLYERIPRKV